MKPTPDRRQFDRFTLSEYFFAAVRPDYRKLGKIIDISRSGLLFHYACDAGEPIMEKGGMVSIDIFSRHWTHFLLGIPCRIVEEDYVVPDNHFITSVVMRYCRAVFLTLSRDTAAGLDEIVNGGAQGAVSGCRTL